MDLYYFFFTLRTKARLILGVTFCLLAAVVAVSLLLPKTYKATTTLLLHHKSFDPVTGTPTPTQLITGFVDTQLDIINSKATALKVVEDRRLQSRPEILKDLDVRGTADASLLRDRIAERLLKKLEIQSSRESSVLKISFKSGKAEIATELANAFAAAYQSTNHSLKTEPLRVASGSFDAHLKAARAAVENTQAHLAAYRKENQLLTSDGDEDVEVARLNELSTELVQIENKLVDAVSKRKSARRDASASPTVSEDQLVRELRAELAKAEAKLANTASTLMPDHPRYIAAEAEIDRIRRDIRAYVSSNIRTIDNLVSILSARRDEVRRAVDAQRLRVIDLNVARDKLAVLEKDVDNAKQVYEDVSKRHSQLLIETQANQPDVSVMHAATRPALPASPRLMLNALVGLIAGLLLGIGLALLQEIMNRSVRSVSEIVHEIGIPVLGQINWTRRSTARKALTFARPSLSR